MVDYSAIFPQFPIPTRARLNGLAIIIRKGNLINMDVYRLTRETLALLLEFYRRQCSRKRGSNHLLLRVEGVLFMPTCEEFFFFS